MFLRGSTRTFSDLEVVPHCWNPDVCGVLPTHVLRSEVSEAFLTPTRAPRVLDDEAVLGVISDHKHSVASNRFPLRAIDGTFAIVLHERLFDERSEDDGVFSLECLDDGSRTVSASLRDAVVAFDLSTCGLSHGLQRRKAIPSILVVGPV